MQNGKILTGVMALLCVGAVGAGLKTWAQSGTNKATIKANKTQCDEHRKDTKEMPKQVAAIEVHVENINGALVKQDAKLEKILDRLK